MRLLAIDPGKCCGWAIFEKGVLEECGVVYDSNLWPSRFPTDTIIEHPEVYSNRHSKGDPNDLLPLVYQAGRYHERFGQGKVSTVLPKEWKKQLPKDVCHKRARAVLTPPEVSVVDAVKLRKDEAHNMLDAVSLGLWHLKRLIIL